MSIPAVIVLVGCLVFNVGAITGQVYFTPVRKVYEKQDISRDSVIKLNGEAYKAAQYDPLEAKYHFALANEESLLSNDSAALNQYKKTLQLNPINGEYLQRFGLFMSGRGDNGVADKLLQTGIKYDRNNPEKYEIYASWLFSQDEKEAGKEYSKLAMAIDPGKTSEFISFMRRYGLSDEDIQSALPERVKAYLVFGDYVYKKGNDKMAEKAYQKALSLDPGNQKAKKRLGELVS